MAWPTCECGKSMIHVFSKGYVCKDRHCKVNKRNFGDTLKEIDQQEKSDKTKELEKKLKELELEINKIKDKQSFIEPLGFGDEPT